MTFDPAVGLGAGEGQGFLKEEQDWDKPLSSSLWPGVAGLPACCASHSV